MSEAATPATFAFGNNEVHGCECPALAAGMDPIEADTNGDPALMKAVGQYDYQLGNQRGVNEGTVGEEIAKNAWIATMNNRLTEGSDALEAAEEVAEYHDWI